MTHDSTHTELEENKAKPKKKKKKKKGPLRLEAIIPIAIIIAALWAYGILFLDSHLRSGTEYLASMSYGAEINIGSVKTKLSDPSLTMTGIQVTDKEKPTHNAVQIGVVRFDLLWDALLRAKIVVSNASVNDVAVDVVRKNPGDVYPPEPKDPNAGPSLTNQVSDTLKKQADEQLDGNIFANIANVMDGSDPNDQLKKIQGELQAEKKVKAVRDDLKSKQNAWNKKLDSLPKGAEVKAISKRIQKTKIDTKDPRKAQKQLKALQKDLKKADAIVKSYEKGQKELTGDVNGFDKALKSIEKSIQNDVKDLEKKLKVPKIETSSITQALFTSLLGDKISQVTGYLDQAKSYLPEKKKGDTETSTEFVPHARSNGRTYTYPVTVGYPLFWLQKASISSDPGVGEMSGDFKGTLVDVTSDPLYINRPAVFNFSGNSESADVQGLQLKAVMDGRPDPTLATLDMKVASHPFPEQAFSKSKDVTFVIQKAKARSVVRAKLEGEKVFAQISEFIVPPKFKTDAKSAQMKEALSSITGGIKKLTMNIKVSGKYSNPKVSLNSNLGDELGRGFKKHLNAKIKEARKKLRKYVDDTIKLEKDKLTVEYSAMRKKIAKQLNMKEADLKKAQKQAEDQVKKKSKIQPKEVEKVKKKAQEKAKDLLKKFKF